MFTAEYLKTLLSYNPETGAFTRIKGAAGTGKVRCGFKRPNGYLDIKIKGRAYRAHRLAWLYMTGAWPTETIDHINGRREDNRWLNLRQLSHAMNCQNRHAPRRGSRSGLIGAHYDKSRDRWTSSILVNGRPLSLGAFPSAQAAHAAYVAAKRIHHPHCPI